MKNARPPLRLVDDPHNIGPELPAFRGKRGRPRRGALPEDDPFVLIDMLDALNGVAADGSKIKRMNVTAAAAFRIFCKMPPILRSLPRLRMKLEEEWGKAPNRKTLESWSSDYGWQEMLRAYDQALARYRLYADEKRRQDSAKRRADLGKWMAYENAQIMKDLLEAVKNGEEEEVIGRDGKKRTRKKTLAGLHALAFAIKSGVEIETVAIGAPTVITDSKVENSGTIVNAHVSLEEWRRSLSAATNDPNEPPASQFTAQHLLPSPASTQGHSRLALPERIVDALSPGDMAELPDEWLSPAEAGSVDASAATEYHLDDASVLGADADPDLDPD